MDDVDGAVTLPASWYPDPDDQNRLRWWDGAAWTEHVQQLPPPPAVPDPEAEAIAEAFVIKRHIPEAGTWYAETGNQYIPRGAQQHDNRPAAVRDDNDDFDKDDDIGSSWTVESIVLSLLPLVAFGLEYFIWTLGDTRGAIFTHNPLTFWIIPALFVVANPILSTMDKGALAARNITTAPNGLIGIFPPVYLLLRLISVGASSLMPLIIWVVSIAVLYSPFSKFVAFFLQILAAQNP
jgi:hypothetical protein